MNIDATFWVAVSFVIFLGIIFYLKVPQKVHQSLEDSIKKIKKDIDDAEKLKDEAKNILSEHEAKVSKSKQEIEILIKKAKEEAEKTLIKKNEEFHNIVENRKKTAEQKIVHLGRLGSELCRSPSKEKERQLDEGRVCIKKQGRKCQNAF